MVEGVGVLLLFWPVSKEGFLQPPGQWQALLGIPVLSRCIFFFFTLHLQYKSLPCLASESPRAPQPSFQADKHI